MLRHRHGDSDPAGDVTPAPPPPRRRCPEPTSRRPAALSLSTTHLAFVLRRLGRCVKHGEHQGASRRHHKRDTPGLKGSDGNGMGGAQPRRRKLDGLWQLRRLEQTGCGHRPVDVRDERCIPDSSATQARSCPLVGLVLAYKDRHALCPPILLAFCFNKLSSCRAQIRSYMSRLNTRGEQGQENPTHLPNDTPKYLIPRYPPTSIVSPDNYFCPSPY